jgi:hypothetical protein
MSRKKFVGDRLSTFFCSLPGSLKNLILRLNYCLVVPRPIEVWASIVSEFHINLAQCVYGFTEQSNLYSIQLFVLENDLA